MKLSIGVVYDLTTARGRQYRGAYAGVRPKRHESDPVMLRFVPRDSTCTPVPVSIEEGILREAVEVPA